MSAFVHNTGLPCLCSSRRLITRSALSDRSDSIAVFRASTVIFPNKKSLNDSFVRDPGPLDRLFDGVFYGRFGGETHREAERKLLETVVPSAFDLTLVSTTEAALLNAVLHFAEQGRSVLLPQEWLTVCPAWNSLVTRLGIQVIFYSSDFQSGESFQDHILQLAENINPSVTVIAGPTPPRLTTVSSLEDTTTQLKKRVGSAVVLYNCFNYFTFASERPGIDIVISPWPASSNVPQLTGLSSSSDEAYRKIRNFVKERGAAACPAGPDDSARLISAMPSVPCRAAAQAKSAETVAAFLRTLLPSLVTWVSSVAESETQRAPKSAAGSPVAFELGDIVDVEKVLNALQVIKIVGDPTGTGDQSTICPWRVGIDGRINQLIFHPGLECADQLVTDLSQALAAAPQAESPAKLE